jgi:hypothetical protein
MLKKYVIYFLNMSDGSDLNDILVYIWFGDASKVKLSATGYFLLNL